VYPEVQGEADSVIVIHENRGLTDWVRVVADRLAESGFVAFCPDFLAGRGPGGGGTQSFADSDEARKAIYELTPDGVSAGIKASMKFLRDLPSTTDQVNVVGFCWGGGQAFRFATEEPSLRAAFVFYGQPPESGFEKLSCPVYGFYGQNDNRINATIEKTQEKTKALGKRYDPVVYPSVGHAFMRTGMDAGADEALKKAVSEAWARMLSLLRNTGKSE
jgi:carboxymethylenebutenolidase